MAIKTVINPDGSVSVVDDTKPTAAPTPTTPARPTGVKTADTSAIQKLMAGQQPVNALDVSGNPTTLDKSGSKQTEALDAIKQIVSPQQPTTATAPTTPATAPAVAPTAPTVTPPATAPAPSVPMATLVNPATGQRVAVAVGSQEAQNYFGQGFTLEGAPPASPQTPQTGAGEATDPKELSDTTEPKQATVEEQINAALARYGITPPDTTKSPVTQAVDNYRAVYEQLGIPTVKAQYDELFSQYSVQQQELADKISDLNENPWITEGLRQGRISDLSKRYELKNAALVGQMNLYKDIIASGQREAQFVAGQVGDTMAAERERYDDLFASAVSSLSAPEDTTAIKEFLFAKGQGFTGDFLDYQKQAKGGEAPTNVREYEYAVSQGYSGTFSDFLKSKSQTMLVGGNPDRQLTLQEATEFGVPYGTTEGQVYGMSGGAQDRANRVETAKTAINLIDQFTQHPGFSGAVGFRLGTALIPGSKATGAVTLFDSLKSLLTLENMGVMKGVLSDADIKILQQASASISRNMSEADMLKQLGLVKEKLNEVITKKGVKSLDDEGVSGGITSAARGIVQGYDITRYATDPNHETRVASIVNGIGKFNEPADIESYIRKVAPKSPVTAEMVISSSQKFGVPPEIIVAIMQQDSSLGTAGLGARTNNPGNVGNDDAGNIVRFPSWQAGVDAVASWLSRKKSPVTSAGSAPAAAAGAIDDLDFGL